VKLVEDKDEVASRKVKVAVKFFSEMHLIVDHTKIVVGQ
jgi:hypothetical protein